MGLPCVDLTPALQSLAQKEGLPVVPFDGHYNSHANRAMAQAVSEFLSQELSSSFAASQWTTAP
jgi:hypothetical protein